MDKRTELETDKGRTEDDARRVYMCRTWNGGSRRIRDSGRLPQTCLFATTRGQLCYILRH